MVKKLLSSEMYLGHMVQGQRRTAFSEGRKYKKVPESEWIIVRNTHEPLVDEDIFLRVKEMREHNRTVHLERRGKHDTLGTEPNILRGLVFCADCKRLMPIIRYLDSYDTFCDFQMITGTREDLSYQVTAQEIADQIRREEITPEDLTEVVNILTAPVARIDEAYYRKDAALLPRRKRELSTQVLEPLASRLDKTRTLAGPPYNLHRMPIQRFFEGVSRLTGNWHYLTVCRDRIMPRLAETRTLFREAVYEISVSDAPERVELLYTILVEPFAALPDM